MKRTIVLESFGWPDSSWPAGIQFRTQVHDGLPVTLADAEALGWEVLTVLPRGACGFPAFVLQRESPAPESSQL